MSPSPEQIEEWKEIFHAVDVKKTHSIDLEEFKQFMQSVDPAFTDKELEIGFDEIDANDNKRITFREFLSWWQER